MKHLAVKSSPFQVTVQLLIGTKIKTLIGQSTVQACDVPVRDSQLQCLVGHVEINQPLNNIYLVIVIASASRAFGCHLDIQTIKNHSSGHPNNFVKKFFA